MTEVPAWRVKTLHNRGFRWYYDHIIDLMMANPGISDKDIGLHVKKHPNTVWHIRNSDMFKAHYEARRRAFKEDLDDSLHNKIAKVANASLDLVLDKMERKRDQIPIDTLKDIAGDALDRLGYGVKPMNAGVPPVSVNIGGMQVVNAPVSASELAEARMALRQVEQQKLASPGHADPDPDPGLGRVAAPSEGAGTDKVIDAEVLHAPIPVTTK